MRHDGSLDMTYPKLGLFMGGVLVSDGGRPTQNVFDPATDEIIGELPFASCDDLDHALCSAQAAKAEWSGRTALDRSQILRKAADILRQRKERIAAFMVREEGKCLSEAINEVALSADIFDWYAEEGRRAYGRVVPNRIPDQTLIVTREAIGVAVAFAPWNFPALTPARKIAGSLAAGCPCILKPAEETPATALELAYALAEAGLPPGILSIVFGEPSFVSDYLISSTITRKISFTGSTPIGRQLAMKAASGLKRMTLELGGHAPVIICADADLDRAVRLTLAAKFRNAGQVCISPTRFLIHQDLYQSFVSAVSQGAAALKIGPGLDPSNQMGPLANRRRVSALESLVDDAVTQGARLLTGGHRIGARGNFFAPAVLADVPVSARIMQEEPFGPVIAAKPFSDLAGAIQEANRLPFGLAAYVFSESGRNARHVSSQIEAGMVGINSFAVSHPETPFGGIKDSGFGSEGGIEGLDAYLVTKLQAYA
jgi:succinate-semialdehyde dehydrogenase/glutarate-semialdehyde dehydrogenase